MRKFALCIVIGLLFVAAATARADTLRLDALKAVELALNNNRQIAQAQAKLDEAAAGKGTAFGSFLPQISGTATYTRLGKANELATASPIPGKSPFTVKDPAGNVIGFTDSISYIAGYRFDTLQLGSQNNYALTGTVQQTLFTWGKLINAYRIAGLNFDLQKEAASQARAQVKVDATQGFYQALLARKTVDVMNDALRQPAGHGTVHRRSRGPSPRTVRANVGLRGGLADSAGATPSPETPPETMNVMRSVLETWSGMTWSRGTTRTLPAKLYDCGKYTATWSVMPSLSRVSRVT